MALQPGVCLGAYEILSPAGAGGMGEVYKARDTRLDRTVAIKILPDALAADPQLRERFDREARAISQLTHPHICVLHDIGHQDGIGFLVMEYLEGETLAQRLTKGALPLPQALQYAIEIASALDHAHTNGIVHRDLKPANILLTRSGSKLLDFGLAKAVAPLEAGAGLSVQPTTPPGLTVQGAIVGTFQYMAPEQLEGLAADARTDIFAFGAVVYEMVTGHKAFEGKSHASLIGAILEREPAPMSGVQPVAPRALERLVQKCLAKDRDQRWQNVRDVRDELKWIAEDSRVAAVNKPGPPVSGRARLAWAGAGVFFVALVVLAMALASRNSSRATSSPDIVRFPLVPPREVSLSFVAYPVVSPDGRRVAFVAIREGISLLWIRSLGQFNAQPLIGTEGAADPFWSHDSRMVGFFANGKLNTVDAAGGPVQPICDAPTSRGATWSQTGVIVFGGGGGNGLFKVADHGGAPSPVTTPDVGSNEAFHATPWFLPDGQHFIYRALPTNTNWVGTLDGNERTQLPAADSNAVYGGPGYLLFLRQAALMAQPFDVATRSVTGEAFPVAEQVLLPTAVARGQFSVSQNGVLAYRAATTAPPTQLAWFDRGGAPLGAAAPPNLYRNPVLSPDGTRIAVERTDPSSRTQDIYTIDVMSGLETRFTFDTRDDVLPVWSPNGTRITFSSNRDGLFGLYEKPSNGERPEQLLFKSNRDHVPYSWSADDFIVFRAWTGTGVRTIGILPISNPRPQLYEEPTSPQTQLTSAELALNGRWILFSRGQSGSSELFVQSFPTPTGKWQISRGGALYGRWNKNSRELFYYAPDSRIMAVPVTDERTFQYRPATPLFKVRMSIGPMTGITNFRQQFDVTPDGKRFLINVAPETEAETPPQLWVVLNWPAALKN